MQGSWREQFRRAAFYLTFGSAVAALFSIAVCHILLAAAFAALVLSRERIELPPYKRALLAFVLWTLVALAASGNPAAGWPQIRKFYVFLIVPLIATLFKDLAHGRKLVLAWTGVAVLSSLWSFVEFFHKYSDAKALNRDFYYYYMPDRITGFMSHWMTLSGEQMIVIAAASAFLFFSPGAKRHGFSLVPGIGVIGLSLVLGIVRSAWFGAAAGVCYLVWFWRKWLLAAVPVAVLVGILASPGFVRARVVSIFQPQKEVDSNDFRDICRRTGLRMIAANPLLGIGPGMVRANFDSYLPPDIRKPLPSGYYDHLHNIYLQYAAERGLPALAAIAWILLSTVVYFARALRRLAPGRSEARFLLHAGIAATIAIAVEGIGEFNLGDSEVLMTYLALIGLGYQAASGAGKDHVRESAR